MVAKKPVTHRDVARLAGVSPAVVSYVINNGPRPIQAATRERVLAAIEALDYHPNTSARGLRAQRTNTIAYISYDYYAPEAFLAPFNASILTALAVELQQRHQYLLPYPLAVGADLTDLRQLLLSRRVDGVVVRLAEDPPITDRLLDVIARSNIPYVCLERRGAERFACSLVTYDDEEGAYAATRYLIGQKHTRIAHIQGDPRQQAARNRLEGYKRAMIDAGLGIDEDLIRGGSWIPSEASMSMRRLLSLIDPPTAVFAASDLLAFGSIEVLRDQGRRVPDDVAVVGFDDAPLARDMIPPLTTVRIPFAGLGRAAADIVLRLIQQQADERPRFCETLTVELVRRGTA